MPYQADTDTLAAMERENTIRISKNKTYKIELMLLQTKYGANDTEK